MRMSGRLDPSKKTWSFFKTLKNVRENSNIASLDVWTSKKRVEWKERSSGRLDPKNRLDEFLTFQAQYDNYEVSSSTWRFEALELNMTIWFGRFDQLTTWKKVFAFFGGYYMLSSSIWPLTWDPCPKSSFPDASGCAPFRLFSHRTLLSIERKYYCMKRLALLLFTAPRFVLFSWCFPSSA